jgi:hypothetical protein
LPGAEIVLAGVADLEAGRESVNASAVKAAATRLSTVGVAIEEGAGEGPAAHELYAQLSEQLGDGAYSRYRSILARVESFAGAAEIAQRG